MKLITTQDEEIIIHKLTVNMKCFEILLEHNNHQILFDINRKHEMFWNSWRWSNRALYTILTVNMKCFEIGLMELAQKEAQT